MNNLAIIGAQWGDEGKAKIVDHLASSAKFVARFQGGANAGHTVVTEQGKFVFHLIPTGILRPDVVSVIGNGVVFDPQAFVSELDQLAAAGISAAGRLWVSARAHVVMPYHKALDALAEKRSPAPIGTTMRGIGPCYRTKAERYGILLADWISAERLRKRLGPVVDWLSMHHEGEDSQAWNVDEMMDVAAQYRQQVRPFVADTTAMLLDHLDSGRGGILFEGAQGTMLDVDHGTYPYVTSSNTTSGGVATGLGIPPSAVHRCVGVSKGYATRVGEGWFPTEDKGELGSEIRRIGNEFGSTTGRPRRCGWLDLVALRYAVRVSGLHSIALTKLDVLDGFKSIRVCVAYRQGSHELRWPPMHPEDLNTCEPIYEEVPGWAEPIAGCLDGSRLPREVRDLLGRIERYLGVPTSLLSTGARRSELITFASPWD